MTLIPLWVSFRLVILPHSRPLFKNRYTGTVALRFSCTDWRGYNPACKQVTAFMKKQYLFFAIALLAVVLGLTAYQNRQALRNHAFNLTGEEGLASQAGGLAQLTLNLTYPPLDLQPYAEIEYADVNPFGINTFLHQEVEPAKREEQVRLIAEAGFHWIRQEFSWQDIEIHGRGDFIDRRNDPAGIDAWGSNMTRLLI